MILPVCFCLVALGARLDAQPTEGRIFLPTPETVSIHEFNGLAGLIDGSGIPSGTVIPDLAGNGLNATVEANGAAPPELMINPGDPKFDVPAGANREFQRALNITAGARVAVNNDGNAYEMKTNDDFSLELYVDREDVAGTANWGILAGTWHSRNMIDDNGGNPDLNGAWYGYGLISYPIYMDHVVESWHWILSPVVNGVPIIGGTAEIKINPDFVIPPGRHYVVLTMDRTAKSAIGYVDGTEVSRMDGLDPTWAFTTPPGRDHARFMMFNGENDSTLGTYMPSPRTTHLDAVRVQRKALSAAEVADIWANIQAGFSSPIAEEAILAVPVTTGVTEVLIGQCVVLTGDNSFPGPGKAIVKWEWKIGDGAFEEGSSTREASFAAASPAGGTEVSLRITNNDSETSTEKLMFQVNKQPAVARFTVKLGAADLLGKDLIVPTGSVLSLDGTTSSSTVPPDAFLCPLSAGSPILPSPIVEFRWDLDGDGTTDDTRPFLDTELLNVAREFKIILTVKNEAGSEGSASVNVKVTAPQGNAEVFHDTPETIFHLEFNELGVGTVASETVFDDLSVSGLHLTVVDPVGGSLAVQDGAIQFDDNRALAYTAGGNGPRGEVRDDTTGIFEMGTGDSFTFELYVKPGDNIQPEWGDMAGTFKARTDGLPDTLTSARYGWGIIKSAIDSPTSQGYALILCYGNGQPAEHQLNFNVQKSAYNYVACVIDRATQNATVYVNGVSAGNMGLLQGWTWETPIGYPPAPFYLFTREQATGQFSNCPSPMAIDAFRLQNVALTADQVTANWENISSGVGADPGVPPTPFKPTGLKVTPGDRQMGLTWNAPVFGPVPTGYVVLRAGVRIADVPATPRSFTDSGRADDTQYCYALRSKNGVSLSDPTDPPVCKRTPAVEPPAGLAAVQTAGQIALSWTAPAGGPTPTGYAIYRNDAPLAEVVGPTTTTYDDKGLQPDTQYCYKVRSKGVGTDGAFTDPPVCERTPAGGFKRGDVDVDGAVNITDVIAFLGWNFRGDPPVLQCPDTADADDSGDLNVTDAIVTLGWQFLGNPPELLPPGANVCGRDDPDKSPIPIGPCNYPPGSCSVP